MIEGLELSKIYRPGRPAALDGVSLRVEPGEIVGVIGPNGSGKTTLMGCLLGLLRPDHGEARVGGHPAGGLKAQRLLGHLPERLGFDPWMKGRAFLAYHHALAGLPPDGRGREVEAALEASGLERGAWDEPLRRYSRGMLQRAGLAQALIGQPRALFLDEPTSGMDPEGALAARERIQAFAESGGAVLINSHQLEQLGKLCHRVLFLKAGRLESGESLRGEGGTAWVVEWAPRPGAQAAARAVLERMDLAAAELSEGGLRGRVADEAQAGDLVAALVQAGLAVRRSGPLTGDLERLFRGGREGRGGKRGAE